ncbi:MAG: hypothetical protein KOO63_06105, partial [Bacteroidales bacterium]|nr:hypothetical protein [Candidatus Latescibacterota bacterium]
EQDKAVINHLEELSLRGKIPLSEKTKQYASYDAIAAAAFYKAIKSDALQKLTAQRKDWGRE